MRIGRRTVVGQPLSAVPYVSQKETESAEFILEQVAFEEPGDFLDYVLAEAKRGKFDVKSLGGLKGYLSGYLAILDQRRAYRAIHARRQVKEWQKTEQTVYDQYRRAKAEALFFSLPEAEQTAIPVPGFYRIDANEVVIIHIRHTSRRPW